MLCQYTGSCQKVVTALSRPSPRLTEVQAPEAGKFLGVLDCSAADQVVALLQERS